MAGRERESNPQYRGVLPNQNYLPETVLDESDPDAVTRSQMNDKYHHLRRVAEGRSNLFLRHHDADEVFGDVYPEFLAVYSEGQLRHLEKLFLMADQDQDQQLSPFELTYWMEKQNNPVTQPELKQIFKVADQNNDGLLSFREFLLFCQKINLKNIPDDDARVPALMGAGNSYQSESGPSCSSKHYPRGQYVESSKSPDSGPTKLRAAVQPHIEEHGKVNLNNAIQFFESEIARETEAAEMNRQVNVDLFKHRKKRRNGASSARTEEPGKGHRQSKGQPKTYRTTATIEVKPGTVRPEAQELTVHLEPELAAVTYKPSIVDMKSRGAPPPPPPAPPRSLNQRHEAAVDREIHNNKTQEPCAAESLESSGKAGTIDKTSASPPRPTSAIPSPPPLPLPPAAANLESKASKEMKEKDKSHWWNLW